MGLYIICYNQTQLYTFGIYIFLITFQNGSQVLTVQDVKFSNFFN